MRFMDRPPRLLFGVFWQNGDGGDGSASDGMGIGSVGADPGGLGSIGGQAVGPMGEPMGGGQSVTGVGDVGFASPSSGQGFTYGGGDQGGGTSTGMGGYGGYGGFQGNAPGVGPQGGVSTGVGGIGGPGSSASQGFGNGRGGGFAPGNTGMAPAATLGLGKGGVLGGLYGAAPVGTVTSNPLAAPYAINPSIVSILNGLFGYPTDFGFHRGSNAGPSGQAVGDVGYPDFGFHVGSPSGRGGAGTGGGVTGRGGGGGASPAGTGGVSPSLGGLASSLGGAAGPSLSSLAQAIAAMFGGGSTPSIPFSSGVYMMPESQNIEDRRTGINPAPGDLQRQYFPSDGLSDTQVLDDNMTVGHGGGGR